jgi:hypothetical protein
MAAVEDKLAEFLSRENLSFLGDQPRWGLEEGPLSTPCWIWAGRTMPNGYGMRTKFRKSVYAHRYYFQAFYGVEIPKGTDLDHLCRRRNCVNPTHLEMVSRQINARRGAGTKLDPEKVQEIVQLVRAGHTTRGIAAQYGLTGGHVSRVSRGLVWEI